MISSRDLRLGFFAGFLIGLLSLPVLKAAKPELFTSFSFFLIFFFLLGVPLGLVVARYISQKIAIIWQIAKFGVIGVLNTFVDVGVLSLFIFVFRGYFSINPEDIAYGGGFLIITFYSFYKGFSFIVANINSYFWNKYWTFEQTVQKKTAAEFAQFFTISVIGFFLNVSVASFVFKSVPAVLGFNVDQWGIIGALAGTVIGMVWNFLGYKFIVFKG